MVLGLGQLAQAGAVASLDDIAFWVGSGPNRAALAIDFLGNDSSDSALTWGYRWDGSATGEDMLLDILAADPRLFAKLSAPSGLGRSVYGLGYDGNDDGQFALSDNTTFDADGIFISGPADGATSVDAADPYAEGWLLNGFWHYGVAEANPWQGAGWTASPNGPTSRLLTDGAWDSWAFDVGFTFTAFAENLVAAESPGGFLAGDFDLDTDVDGADFLIWQRGYGIASGATISQGDANDDGMVDSTDLQLWSANFGSGTTGHALSSAALAVPEPPGSAWALWVFFILILGSRHTTRRLAS